ncbi:unnamed protein product [Cuscuta europaea]|uniref:Uncharacterized protein n=1 Tax=Cuscuta europaea TaxID=41803 RepID=A0A9P0VVZ4_CUSEU|nr:unnamed protein product [Cuscuta europaea]
MQHSCIKDNVILKGFDSFLLHKSKTDKLGSNNISLAANPGSGHGDTNGSVLLLGFRRAPLRLLRLRNLSQRPCRRHGSRPQNQIPSPAALLRGGLDGKNPSAERGG